MPAKTSKITAIAGGSLALVGVVALAMYNLSGIGHSTVQLIPLEDGPMAFQSGRSGGDFPAAAESVLEANAGQGTFVVVWHSDLKPEPNDNAGVVLVYHDEGLLARLGRVWVCWADLRTEYIKAEELQRRLRGGVTGATGARRTAQGSSA